MRPSGLTCGSVTAFTAAKSANVIGRFAACALAASGTASRSAKAVFDMGDARLIERQRAPSSCSAPSNDLPAVLARARRAPPGLHVRVFEVLLRSFRSSYVES